MSPTERSTPFQEKHAAQYGLEISTRDSETKTVTSVLSRFCRFLTGKKVGQKWKPSSVTKNFKVPLRPALYTHHLVGQHSFKWTEYQALEATEKESYFISVVPVVNTLNAHFAGAGDQLLFNIDVPIVKTIIRNLLFGPYANDETVESDLMMLEPC
jgi:hypothetical protein